jgi:hypothetical protein
MRLCWGRRKRGIYPGIHDGLATEMQEVEEEEDERFGVTGIRCVLYQAEGRGAIGTNAAQLAVEMGLLGRK